MYLNNQSKSGRFEDEHVSVMTNEDHRNLLPVIDKKKQTKKNMFISL